MLFGLISFVNHWTYKTSSDSLGIYTNALWDYIHFRPNDCKLLTPQNANQDTPFFTNKLSDHFNPVQFLWAPLLLVFKSWTLLLIQWAYILFGGFGIWKIFLPKGVFWANIALLHFFSIWGIYSALGFDYHDNVIAAMLIPWLYLFFKQERSILFFIALTIMLCCKETVSFYMIFFSITFFLLATSKRQKILSLTTFALSITYFLVVTKWVMPALGDDGRGYIHFRYSALGESYSDVLIHAIQYPFKTARLFFVNHLGDPWYDWIKIELYVMMLLAGAWALIRQFQFLIILLPIIAQKVLFDGFIPWGLNSHYSIELVPLLTIPLFLFWTTRQSLFSIETKYWALGCWLVTLSSTLLTNEYRISKWHDKCEVSFLNPCHYSREFDLSEVREASKIIPNDPSVAVCAQTSFVPRFSIRDDIYEFPVLENAQFVFLVEKANTYPISREEYEVEVKKLITNPNWELKFDGKDVKVYQRKSTN